MVLPSPDDLTPMLEQDLPPVGAYETWHAMGKQATSLFKTLPSYGFGSSNWGTEGKRYLSTGHVKELQVSQTEGKPHKS